MAARNISSSGGGFPYTDPTICYIAVDGQGNVDKVKTADMVSALQAAKDGEIKMYAVWPGKTRSDLFLIDSFESITAAWQGQ
jgi:hypothetical protein